MWIQLPLLVLLGVVAISAAMAIRKAKTTKKQNQQQDNDPPAMVMWYGCGCSKENELTYCNFPRTSSCFCTDGRPTSTDCGEPRHCAAPSAEHHCPPPTNKCYYQHLDRPGVWVNDVGCSGIRPAPYNRTCNEIVSFDRTQFAYYNCMDNGKSDGICANKEVCNYNDDNSYPWGYYNERAWYTEESKIFMYSYTNTTQHQ